MGLVWLELAVHNQSLVKKIRESCHNDRVKHIDLQEEAVAHMEAIKWNGLHKGYPSDELGIIPIDVPPIAHSKGVVN